MTTPLLLILVAAMAFLATHVAYEWLAKRLLIVSGAEYLVLGVLLGPHVTGLFSPAALEAFQPLVVLGIGWMGITTGMPVRLTQLVRIPAVAYRLSLVESVVTLALVSIGAASAFAYGFQLDQASALVPAIALGAIAVASTPAGLDVAFGGRRRSVPVLQQIEVAHGMDGMISVLAFGGLIAFLHDADPLMIRSLTTTEWIAVTLGIGTLGGTLFHLFLGNEESPDRLVIALGGAVILTSGAAAYLQLSPSLATFVMGVILANSLRRPGPVAEVLRSGERPLYYMLLVIAGVSWRPESNIVWWLVIGHYIILRTLAKLWGTGIVTWLNRRQSEVGLDWGRALIGQGRLTIALALDYSRRDLPYGEVVFTCAAVSVLFTEFFAARFVRSAAEPLMLPIEQFAATTEAVAGTVTETMTQALPGFLRVEREEREVPEGRESADEQDSIAPPDEPPDERRTPGAR
jgi:Kef-type K+ transport system membrane component KefB